MQSSFQTTKNPSYISVKFPDGSTLSSAKTFNDDIQFNKRIRVSNNGNFDKDLYVTGKIYGKMASIDPLSKEYTDLRTGWPWETFTDTYDKDVDSLFAHVDVIEKAPYATESYVIDSNANTNGIIRVLPIESGGEGYPMFSDVNSKYLNPVTTFIQNEILIINKNKTSFKFQEPNLTIPGKVLICLDTDGTVGWGDPVYNQVSAQNIVTTFGQATTTSFTISDTKTGDSFPDQNLHVYMNLPSTATNKNQLVQNRTIAMISGCLSGGFTSGSQPPVLVGCYSLGSEGISFQAGYLDTSSNYLSGSTSIGGGKRYAGTQQIRLDTTGIHLSSDLSGTNLWGNVFIRSRIVGVNLTQPPGSSTNYPATDIPAVLTIGNTDLAQKNGKLIVNGNNTSGADYSLSITGHSNFNGNVEIQQELDVTGPTYLNNQVVIDSTIQTEIKSDCKFSGNFLIDTDPNSTKTTIINRKLRYGFNFPSSYDSNKTYYIRNDGSTGDLKWDELPVYSSGDTNIVNKKTVFNDDISLSADINYVSISPGIAGIIAASALAYELAGNDEIIGLRHIAPNEKSQFYWKFVTNTSVVYPFKILSDRTISSNLVCANTQYPALEFVTYDGNNNAIPPSETQRVFDNAIITDTINYTLSNNTVIQVTPLAPSKFKLVGDFWFRSGAVQSGSPLTWSYAIPNKGDMLVYWGDLTDILDNGKGEKMYRAVWKNFSDIMPSNLTKSTYFRNTVSIGSKNSYTYDQYNTTNISGTANAQNVKVNGKLFYQYVSDFNTPTSATSPLNYVLTCINATTGECDWRTMTLPSSGTSLTLDTLTVNSTFTSNGTNTLLNLAMQATNSLAKIDNIQLKNISIMNDVTYPAVSGKILTCTGTEVVNGTTFGIMKLQEPTNIFSNLILSTNPVVGKYWKCTNNLGAGEWADVSTPPVTDTFISFKKVGTATYPASVGKILTCTEISGTSPYTGTAEWSDTVTTLNATTINATTINSSIINCTNNYRAEIDTYDVASVTLNPYENQSRARFYTDQARTIEFTPTLFTQPTSVALTWTQNTNYYLTFFVQQQIGTTIPAHFMKINITNPSSPKKHAITVENIMNITHTFNYTTNYNGNNPSTQDYNGYYFVEKIITKIYDETGLNNYPLQIENPTLILNGGLQHDYLKCLLLNHHQQQNYGTNPVVSYSIPTTQAVILNAHFMKVKTSFVPWNNSAYYYINYEVYITWRYSGANKTIDWKGPNMSVIDAPFQISFSYQQLFNTIDNTWTMNPYYQYGRATTYDPYITGDYNTLKVYQSMCKSVYYYTCNPSAPTYPLPYADNVNPTNVIPPLPSDPLNNFNASGITSLASDIRAYYNSNIPTYNFNSPFFSSTKNVLEARNLYSEKIYCKSAIYCDSGFLFSCGIAGRQGIPLYSSTGQIDSNGNYYGSYSNNTYGSKLNFWWSNQATVDIWADYTKVVSLPMNTCDYRIKSNIKEPLPVLQRLSEIPIHSYDLNFERKLSPHESQYEGKEIVFSPNHIGPFAHELQEKFPELTALVSNEKNAVGDTGEPQYQNVNHHEMIFLLMKAVQELNDEIKNLKMELNEIKQHSLFN